jgi:hypothetical protein
MAQPLLPAGTPREKIFYVTFGVEYRTRAHPLGFHPDGYVIIVADDVEQARGEAWSIFGTTWSMLYDHWDLDLGRFSVDTYPQGCLGVFYANPEKDCDGPQVPGPA